jgi:hypothetical protein
MDRQCGSGAGFPTEAAQDRRRCDVGHLFQEFAMLLTTRVIADSKVAFETTADIDGPRLIATAAGREEMARDRGPDWVDGAVTAFTHEFVEAAEQQYEESEVGLLATNLAMVVWLRESVFGGVTQDDFLNSDLVFTVGADAVVSYARVPKLA